MRSLYTSVNNSFKPIPVYSVYNDVETTIWYEDPFGGKVYSYKGTSFDWGKDGINIGYALGGGYNILTKEWGNETLGGRIDVSGPSANAGGYMRVGIGGGAVAFDASIKGASISTTIAAKISYDNIEIETHCTGEAGVGAGVKGGVAVSTNKASITVGVGAGVMASVGCGVDVKNTNVVSKEEIKQRLMEYAINKGQKQ